ncbi:MAG: CxxxxCH/CxxCH domain-containing protein [Geobacteraceae bacterium]|nr:CxxxxCH/CxxCH domain-containing protein [Geobacteraceae bacterium]
MKEKKPQKQLLQFVMLALLSAVSVLVTSGEAMAALQCYSCHGGLDGVTPSTDVRPIDDATHRNITTGGFVGSHRKHMAPTATTADCTVCHTDNGTNQAHRDGQIGMVAAPGYSKPLFFNQTSAPVLGTCSTASCHANVYGTGTVGTPTWGVTAANCTACHSTPIGTNGPATGNHTNVAAHAVACTACHSAGTSATVPPTAGHNDGNIDTANVGYATLNKTKGTPGTTCSTAACHASPVAAGPVVTPAWGTTGNGCTSCHSGVNAITATGPATGNHGIAGHTVACTSCHEVSTTATVAPTVGHRDGNIDIANVGYATLNKTKGTAGTTCSAASCHASPVAATLVTTPAWGTTGNGCAACHTGVNAITATGPATGNHGIAGHTVACTSCHEASTTATVAPTVGHADGNIDIANVGYATLNKTKGTAGTTCSAASCHASPVAATLVTTPAWGTTGNGCAACHTGVNAITATGPATGNHGITGHTVACTSCHEASTTATVAPTVGHADGNIDIANVGYATPNKTKGTAGTTCSAASCHASPVAATLVTTPAWGTTGNGCAACHTGVNAITATGPATGNHGIAGHTVACTSCHEASTTATVAPTVGHADGNIDIANVGYATLNKTKGTAGTTCSAASCHASPVAATLVTTPAWGTTGNGCAACHTGVNAITATGPATGNHGIAGHTVACTSCHEASTTATVAPTVGHADGNIDIANVGYATPNKTKGTAGTTCSAASCHASPVAATLVTTPAWGTTGNGCAACHTGVNAITINGPVTGAHSIHAGKACVSCHEASTTSTVAPTVGHADGNIDIANVGYATPNKLKGSPYATCSAASCHSPFLNTPADTALNWGDSAGGCYTCHAIPTAAGSHDPHMLNAISTACTACHTTEGGAGHVNGTIDVTQGYPPTPKHNAGVYSGTCSTSCHNAYSTTAGKTTPTWGTTATCSSCHDASPVTGSHTKHIAHSNVTCDSCHTNVGGVDHVNNNIDVNVGGYAPVVAKHLAGSGYNSCSNISCHNGGTGAAAFVANPATWNSPLDCNGCHGYPPASTNHADAGGKDCNSCHSNVVLGGTVTSSTFSNLQLHLNGTVEGGKCDSCHGYPPVQTMVGLVNYSGAKIQNYSGGGGVHAVAGHLNPFIRPTAGFGTAGASAPGCATCHPENQHNSGAGTFLTANVQVVVDQQFKFDKNRPIVYTGKQSGTGKTSGQCSNVACHFQKSPQWSTEAYTQSH